MHRPDPGVVVSIERDLFRRLLVILLVGGLVLAVLPRLVELAASAVR